MVFQVILKTDDDDDGELEEEEEEEEHMVTTEYINTKTRKLTSDSEICSPDHDESGSFGIFHSELCLVIFLSKISDDLCE